MRHYGSEFSTAFVESSLLPGDLWYVLLNFVGFAEDITDLYPYVGNSDTVLKNIDDLCNSQGQVFGDNRTYGFFSSVDKNGYVDWYFEPLKTDTYYYYENPRDEYPTQGEYLKAYTRYMLRFK